MLIRQLTRASVLAAAAMFTGLTSNELKDDRLHGDEVSQNYNITFSDELKKLINFEENNNKDLNGKICRAFIPKHPEGKPLFILVLGHIEKLDRSTEESGIISFYERLIKEERGSVLLFRTGLVLSELESMADPENKNKPEYEPQLVFDETKSIIKDFISKYNPSEIRASGFSWGGGTIAKLAKEDDWQQNIPVKRTVMIDPICFGTFGFGAAMRTRPEFSNSPDHKNFHIYQRDPDLPLKDWLTTLQGDYPIKVIKDSKGKILEIKKDERTGDKVWKIANVSHTKLDDVKEVREKAYDFLVSS